jgi:DNA-binding NarL/FixJ family response regulator
MHTVLLVEPDDFTRDTLRDAMSPLAFVECHRSFETARARLRVATFDFMVTNLRLGAYNGLHLVYTGASGPESPKAVVYSDKFDASVAREVQRAGAFYETSSYLPITLAAYLTASLPTRDRRDPAIYQPGALLPSGQRSSDVQLSS